jgi:hypothetical protein
MSNSRPNSTDSGLDLGVEAGLAGLGLDQVEDRLPLARDLLEPPLDAGGSVVVIVYSPAARFS